MIGSACLPTPPRLVRPVATNFALTVISQGTLLNTPVGATLGPPPDRRQHASVVFTKPVGRDSTLFAVSLEGGSTTRHDRPPTQKYVALSGAADLCRTRPILSSMNTPHGASAPSPSKVALIAATHAFFPEGGAVLAVGDRNHLARIETASGVWKVRRWPSTIVARRIAFVHAAMGQARQEGVPVPEVASLPPARGGGTVLSADGQHYDAQRWLPGRAALPTPSIAWPHLTDHLPLALPDELVAEAARQVARVHRATSGLAIERDLPLVGLDGLEPAVLRIWSGHRDRLRPVAVNRPDVQRWLALSERTLPLAREAMAASPVTSNRPSVILHLGLWPAHLLFLDDGKATAEMGEERVVEPGLLNSSGSTTLTGLIGWERAAAGSPLLDLAQLIVRCRGWNAGAAELAIAAYCEVRALPPEERRLLPTIAALDLIATAGTVLDLAFGPTADGAPPSRLRAAVTFLVNSLEVVANVVAQGERPVRHGRRWEYGPRTAPPPVRSSSVTRRPVKRGPRGQKRRK